MKKYKKKDTLPLTLQPPTLILLRSGAVTNYQCFVRILFLYFIQNGIYFIVNDLKRGGSFCF